MARIRLGPAGNCILEPGQDTTDSLKNISGMGLNAQEIEFVRSIYMNNQAAGEVGRLAKRLNISLSIHASYYINLASADAEKRKASMKRILDACERGHHMGASHVVFHPAYYGKLSPDKAYGTVRDAVNDMQAVLHKRGWKVRLAPETTGKVSQWGTLDEIMKLARETGCSFCVDFAHIFARNRGNIDYGQLLDKIQKAGHSHMHCHFSNINYGLKGELNHLVLDGKPPFEPLAKEIFRRGLDATIISESPITWKDSVKMKGIFEKLGYKFK